MSESIDKRDCAETADSVPYKVTHYISQKGEDKNDSKVEITECYGK